MSKSDAQKIDHYKILHKQLLLPAEAGAESVWPSTDEKVPHGQGFREASTVIF